MGLSPSGTQLTKLQENLDVNIPPTAPEEVPAETSDSATPQ